MLNTIIRAVAIVGAVVGTVLVVRKAGKIIEKIRVERETELAELDATVNTIDTLIERMRKVRVSAIEQFGIGAETMIVGKQWQNGRGSWVIPRNHLEIPEGKWLLRCGQSTALLMRTKLTVTLCWEMDDEVKIVTNDNEVRKQYINEGYGPTLDKLNHQLTAMA